MSGGSGGDRSSVSVRQPAMTMAGILVCQLQFLAMLSLVDSTGSTDSWLSEFTENLRFGHSCCFCLVFQDPSSKRNRDVGNGILVKALAVFLASVLGRLDLARYPRRCKIAPLMIGPSNVRIRTVEVCFICSRMRLLPHGAMRNTQ